MRCRLSVCWHFTPTSFAWHLHTPRPCLLCHPGLELKMCSNDHLLGWSQMIVSERKAPWQIVYQFANRSQLWSHGTYHGVHHNVQEIGAPKKMFIRFHVNWPKRMRWNTNPNRGGGRYSCSKHLGIVLFQPLNQTNDMPESILTMSKRTKMYKRCTDSSCCACLGQSFRLYLPKKIVSIQTLRKWTTTQIILDSLRKDVADLMTFHRQQL